MPAARYGPTAMISPRGVLRQNTHIFVYLPGTSTLATVYTDAAQTTTAANPVQTDGGGNLTFYAAPGDYDLAVNSTDTPLTVSVTLSETDPFVHISVLDAPYNASYAAADNTAAIQAALNDIPTAGAEVDLGAGRLTCLGQLTYPVDRPFKLKGRHHEVTRLVFPNSIGVPRLAPASIPSATAANHQSVIEDVGLDGPLYGSAFAVTNTSPTSDDGIQGYRVLRLNRVRAEGFRFGWCPLFDHWSADYCQFGNNWASMLLVDAHNDATMVGTILAGNYFASIVMGQDASLTSSVLLNCHLGFAPYGIYRFRAAYPTPNSNTSGGVIFTGRTTFENTPIEEAGNAAIYDESYGTADSPIVQGLEFRGYYFYYDTSGVYTLPAGQCPGGIQRRGQYVMHNVFDVKFTDHEVLSSFDYGGGGVTDGLFCADQVQDLVFEGYAYAHGIGALAVPFFNSTCAFASVRWRWGAAEGTVMRKQTGSAAWSKGDILQRQMGAQAQAVARYSGAGPFFGVAQRAVTTDGEASLITQRGYVGQVNIAQPVVSMAGIGKQVVIADPVTPYQVSVVSAEESALGPRLGYMDGAPTVGQTTASMVLDPLAVTDAGNNIKTVTTTYSMVDADRTILGDTTGGAFTITLPTITRHAGRRETIKNIGANTLTVTPRSGQAIDGVVGSKTLAQWAVLSLACDGTAWYVV